MLNTFNCVHNFSFSTESGNNTISIRFLEQIKQCLKRRNLRQNVKLTPLASHENIAVFQQQQQALFPWP